MSNEKSRPLPVRVGKGHVGSVGRSDIHKGGTNFRYSEDAASIDAISLVMPVRWDSYEWHDSMIPILSMHMPEGQLRAELQNMFAKTKKGFDDLDLLAIVGPHQLGRVSVGHVNDTEFPDLSIDELLIHDSARGLFDDLMKRYAAMSGVSGVQPKILVRDEASNDLDRVTHRGATHIVKSWREEDYPELAANEFFCMRAAAYAGLTVPDIKLSANGKLLIVDRFDVTEQGYLGFEDLCVLNGWPPQRKYDGSYEGAARQLSTFLSPERVREGLESLFVTVALSTGVRNGDAHLKNFGVMYRECGEDSDVWMAPTYDIVSTTPYKPNDIMAMFLAGSKNWPKHKLLVEFGRRSCQLGEGRCRELMEQVADGMSKARGELIEHLQDHSSFELIGSRMVAEWERGLARSLVAENRPVTVDLGAKAKRGPGM
ncbi:MULTISPECIES: type II toxin-antitoxin system HipA family toxin [Pseudomonas syringae group]|uniref:type II toxin-antitoxin system HipA family toxin n=1 Tax=Pseudomonas syringae group TaxID=136849 RepID=UPI000EFDBA27|nr:MULTISPECIES: type II toxin-antitoxin system HipA family toxin [Pseudomonas syringae group]MDH4602433.1 type II toxin-antitoxin system HipA family toxin [Pseudomonas syringae pv. papulans]